MITRAQKTSIAVAVVVASPLLALPWIQSALAGRPALVSFIQRCPGDDTALMLAACVAASLACFAGAYGLGRSIYLRGRGHSLNGITYCYTVRDVVQGVAFCAVFFAINGAPCWVVPSLYVAVAASTAVTGIASILREPMLVRVKHVRLDDVLSRHLALAQVAPEPRTGQTNPVLISELLAALAEFQRDNDALRLEVPVDVQNRVG